jgi:putative membrane protein
MKLSRLLKTSSLIALALVVSTAAQAAPSNTTQASPSRTTRDFINNAVVANKFEIDSSQLALQKSQSNDVKDFAQRMIDDHTKAGQQIQDTLEQEKLSGLAPQDLDKKHQKLEDKLSNDTGAKFDKDYLSAQVDAHKEAVSLFKKYSEKGDDPGLKTAAADILPTLQQHKQMVDDLKKNYSKTAANTSNGPGIPVNRLEPAAGNADMSTDTNNTNIRNANPAENTTNDHPATPDRSTVAPGDVRGEKNPSY